MEMTYEQLHHVEMEDSFNKAYEKEIVPQLQLLETERLKIQKIIIITIFTILGVALIALALRNIFIAIIPVIVGIIVTASSTNKFKSSYKDKIMPILLKLIGDNLYYNAEQKIDLELIKSSDLFQKPDEYRGEDYVRGKLGKTAFEFSEVHLIDVYYTSNGKTTTRHERTIFKGKYYIFDFNKHFNSITQIRPNSTLSGFTDKLNIFGKVRKTTLEDVDFEKYFDVYTSDEIECRYLITPNLMEKIKNIYRNSGELYISFIHSNIHIAISTTKNSFEPTIMSTLFDKKAIYDHYLSFKLIQDLLDELDLNTRIWTKQ